MEVYHNTYIVSFMSPALALPDLVFEQSVRDL